VCAICALGYYYVTFCREAILRKLIEKLIYTLVYIWAQLRKMILGGTILTCLEFASENISLMMIFDGA